ncbi:MAG: hypothetical protein AAFM92_02015 [Pseudomonadota bacterium]
MGQTLHLHVGLPKCGSSTLQAVLKANRSRLLEQGFDYVRVSDRGFGNLTPYMKSLSGGGGNVAFQHFSSEVPLDTARENLFAAIDASCAPNIILSAEGASHQRRINEYRELTDRFESVKLHIVFRPWVEWVVSHYAQGVKTGKYRSSLETFLRSDWFAHHVVSNLRFAEHVDYWSERLGGENVHVHFVGARFASVVDQFLNAVGVALTEAERTVPRRNQSPSAFVLTALVAAQTTNRRAFLKAQKRIVKVATNLDPRPDASLLTRDIEAMITPFFEGHAKAFLAQQTAIAAEDLWPDYSDRHSKATTYDDMVATNEFGRVMRKLDRRGIVVDQAAGEGELFFA